MTNQQIAEIIGEPEYLLHRYDEAGDQFQFLHVPRETHRSSTFLTSDYLPPDLRAVYLNRQSVLATDPKPGPIHFIFHSAYCCSTMLARAFDIEGVSMGLKEPVVLNDMIGWRRRGGHPAKIGEVLHQSLDLLARPFRPGEVMVVKPSNIVNSLADAMLAMRPGASALLLYAPLRSYLISIVKKGLWGRLWVRELLVGLLKDGALHMQLSTEELLGLTDIQIAAVGWLSQHRAFADLLTKYGNARIKTLNSEVLLTRSADCIAALAAHYRLELADEQIQAVIDGPAFGRHSKFDGNFDAESRAQEQEEAARLHHDEIEKVTIWAEALASSQGISMMIEGALLS
ncbi:hypothetical protein [Parasphingorhabdus sp.]|uniref:hypothetical protein n=1 Tax=Parasphingorhabdus sp. TaxID=2709688 RepID=UPI0030030704